MLTKETEYATTCDGCGRTIPASEPRLGSIESCCGGCYRHLCRECVLRAAALMEETMNDEPRDFLNETVHDEPNETAREAGQPDVEMTLAQWVETLPPGHGAREELVILAKSAAVMLLQLDRLPLPPGVEEDDVEGASSARVDAVLRRLLASDSELVTARAQKDHYAAQLARLPHGQDDLTEASIARVDAVLQRVLDAEGALASLVYLARQCGEAPRHPEGLDAAIEAAQQILDHRPRGMGGTAHGVSR